MLNSRQKHMSPMEFYTGYHREYLREYYREYLSKICTQSVSLVVYYTYMTFIKKSYPFMVHPLLPVPRSYRNLGVIPG